MSQRSDIDARYNQHLINGYSSDEAWDMAITELGGNFGHYKVVDGRVETTSAYQEEQARIAQEQAEYDAWIENPLNTDSSDPTALESTSTYEQTNIQESGGNSVERTTNYTSTNTEESLAWRARADELKAQKAELDAQLRADGATTTFRDPKIRALNQQIADAELAEERTQLHSTTRTVTQYDADGNVIPDSDQTVVSSFSTDAETGTQAVNANTTQPQNVGVDGTEQTETATTDAPLVTEDSTTVSTIDDDLDAEPEAASNTQNMMEEDFEMEQSPTPEPTVAELRQNKASKDDWRVRLRLAPQSDYLYNAPNPGILSPLKETDGIVFPYMPRIDTVHQARYSNYDLPHSNYRGYFYAGTHQERVIVSATFTAQDTKEANYLLATLHFLRSCTKMFYGQDMQRGTPPPLVFLSGLGDYQFNEHPCAIELVNINLPNDVDYIKAGNTGSQDTDFMSPMSIRSNQSPSFGSALNRLFSSGLSFGGTEAPTYTSERIFTNSNNEGTTRVPTKMDINFNLVPIQTRDQISNEYSVKDYSNGSLLKKGFW